MKVNNNFSFVNVKIDNEMTIFYRAKDRYFIDGFTGTLGQCLEEIDNKYTKLIFPSGIESLNIIKRFKYSSQYIKVIRVLGILVDGGESIDQFNWDKYSFIIENHCPELIQYKS